MNNINFENFKKIFDSQEKCINILIENGYIQTTYCSNCNSNKIRKLTGAMKNNYMCKACKKVSNIFKNTVFFNSFVALIDWFYIIYLFINFDIQIPERIAKETKRSWTTIDKALKKIKKEFENQEIKEKFNFLLDTNINANINNVNDLSNVNDGNNVSDLNNVNDENNVSDVNLSTTTEKDYFQFEHDGTLFIAQTLERYLDAQNKRAAEVLEVLHDSITTLCKDAPPVLQLIEGMIGMLKHQNENNLTNINEAKKIIKIK